MDTVMVLNAGFEPLHRVDIKHAINMLVRGVATVLQSREGHTIGPFPHPVVVILTRYVRMSWKTRQRNCSKDAVKRRDGKCAYCGGRADTVDHVLPRSRGGRSDWLNLVAACRACNQRKADRTPEEAGMKLLVTPHVPRLTATVAQFGTPWITGNLIEDPARD